MSIVKRCFNQLAESMLRACYVLVLILAWQATNAPLMSRFGSTVLQFPQVVFNGGSTTSFNINNPSSTKKISVTVQLYSRQGAPLANQQVSLMPGASDTVVFGDAQLSLETGWAELKSDDEFIATEFFQLFLGGSRVGVLPSPASEEIRFFGFVNSEFKSGLAVHNPSPTEATQFTVRLKDMAGQEPVAEKTVTLAALGSQASFLDEDPLFGSALSSFEGVVEISVSSPPVAVLSLIQDNVSGAVATVAVEVQSFVVTGPSNTSLGRGALVSNTTGTTNTATGVDALSSNTEGSGNAAAGHSALAANTTGNFNTATGFFALSSNTEGFSNTATGVSALVANTTGDQNTATGVSALAANTLGTQNTATGVNALSSNTEGNSSTANGVNALRRNTEGDNNTAIGANALFSNTEGNSSTAIGNDALVNNTDGIFNTAIGANALASNESGSQNTAIGLDTLRNNTEGFSNTANGISALKNNTEGDFNTANGIDALISNRTGSDNTVIGAFADVTASDLTNATAIGANAKVDASNKIRLGDPNVSVIEAEVGLTVVSDKTKKENFQLLDGEAVLSKLRSLEVPSWNFIGQDPEKFRHYGPMAQDFFAAFGHDGVGTIATPTTINTSDLAGILMIAIQTLEKRTAENAELKTRVEKLERAIQKMR